MWKARSLKPLPRSKLPMVVSAPVAGTIRYRVGPSLKRSVLSAGSNSKPTDAMFERAKPTLEPADLPGFIPLGPEGRRYRLLG